MIYSEYYLINLLYLSLVDTQSILKTLRFKLAHCEIQMGLTHHGWKLVLFKTYTHKFHFNLHLWEHIILDIHKSTYSYWLDRWFFTGILSSHIVIILKYAAWVLKPIFTLFPLFSSSSFVPVLFFHTLELRVSSLAEEWKSMNTKNSAGSSGESLLQNFFLQFSSLLTQTEGQKGCRI